MFFFLRCAGGPCPFSTHLSLPAIRLRIWLDFVLVGCRIRAPADTRLVLARIERKIGCDKGLPSCNNCVRTGRECMGYGLRLVWPDIPDGRRKSPKLSLQHSHGQLQASGLYYGQQFLNISFDDIEQNRQDVSTLTLQDHHARPQQALRLHPDLVGHEADLLAYCELSNFPPLTLPAQASDHASR